MKNEDYNLNMIPPNKFGASWKFSQCSNFRNLRKKYPKFFYESFDYKISNGDLKIVFYFYIPPRIVFKPEIVIEKIDKKRLEKIGDHALDNLVFNTGLIEMLSYWKTTCSPEIEIRAGHLDYLQTKWWKDLLLKGMGQFFYENKIDWRKKDFIKIVSLGKNYDIYKGSLENRYMIPFAGGRDSIVTLEKIKEEYGNDKISLFTVNPIGKIQRTVKVSGIKKQIIVRRIVDKKLLDLNKKGYLNGHTPFTSLLSFISVLCGVLFNYKNITFSNEKSANEGNVKYLGRVINHQWAKSSEFEKMFRDYCRKFLAKNVNYFSFSRKYTELEISKMLMKYPKYFPVFSSCNAGMRISAKMNERWCGECPKCLFVYLSLYPFLTEAELHKIFGKKILEDRKLLPILKQLTGKEGIRPFECVGTIKESKLALELSIRKAKTYGKIPFLLKNNA
ncbi:MAG: hypothetical protein V1756_03205 [Patescibacteria group bacterium]